MFLPDIITKQSHIMFTMNVYDSKGGLMSYQKRLITIIPLANIGYIYALMRLEIKEESYSSLTVSF